MIYKVSTQDLVVLVNKEKRPMVEVMAITGMSRQGIWKRLKEAGVFIPRSAPGGAPGKRTKVACGFCGVIVERYQQKLVKLRQMQAFCTQECYFSALEQHGFEEWRHGSRLARTIVSQHFPLQPEHIVHHKDSDQRHNDLSNLMVFASQSDHMAHHRGRKVLALFDGEIMKRAKSITHEP